MGKWIKEELPLIAAWTLAIGALVMFFLPIGFHIIYKTQYDFTDYATFVGGTAGPMAALAGFLFIYLTFQHQQDQLDKHEKQFERQSFDNTFFNLLNYYRELALSFTVRYDIKPSTMEEFSSRVRKKIGFINEDLTINTTPVFVEDTIREFRSQFSNQKSQIKNVITPLLEIVRLILTLEKKSQLKYFNILESQISDSHFFLYFYYYIAYGDIEDKEFFWSDRKNMYALLKRVRTEILISPHHIKWIENAPYKPGHPMLPNKPFFTGSEMPKE